MANASTSHLSANGSRLRRVSLCCTTCHRTSCRINCLQSCAECSDLGDCPSGATALPAPTCASSTPATSTCRSTQDRRPGWSHRASLISPSRSVPSCSRPSASRQSRHPEQALGDARFERGRVAPSAMRDQATNAGGDIGVDSDLDENVRRSPYQRDGKGEYLSSGSLTPHRPRSGKLVMP